MGLFRINMHGDNLGIENECHWAVPIMPGEEIDFWRESMDVEDAWVN